MRIRVFRYVGVAQRDDPPEYEEDVLKELYRQEELAREAAHYPTLDCWLSALHRDDVELCIIHEPSAAKRVPNDRRMKELTKQARARRRRWCRAQRQRSQPAGSSAQHLP